MKMIVTDLDDTLLKTDKTISQYTIDIIKEVSKQGLRVIFATARGPSSKKLISYDLFDGHVLMNIAKDEIIAFGDDINDKEMLLNCGLSVAVGNALDDIKEITDYICDSNDNDGVANWLEENILRGKL